MARITIDLPDTFRFSTQVRIRISDIGTARHTSHDSLISLLHEARVRFLDSIGFTEMDAGGAGLIMSDLAVVYKTDTFYGDCLEIQVTAGEFQKHGCDFFYRALHADTGKIILEAKTGMVFFDYHAKQIVPVPERFLSRAG